MRVVCHTQTRSRERPSIIAMLQVTCCALALFATQACIEKKTQEPDTQTQPEAKPKTRDAISHTPPKGFPNPVAPAVTPQKTSGIAWFGTKTLGLVKLEGGIFNRVIVSPTHIQQIVSDGSDGVWVRAQYRIYHVIGDTYTQVPIDTDFGAVEKLASGPKGDLWAISNKKIGHLDGENWSFSDRSSIAPNQESITIKDIDVDRLGRIFITSPHAFYIFRQGEWREVKPDLSPKDALQSVLFFGESDAWVLTRQTLIHATRGKWETVYRQIEPPGMRRLAARPDGQFVVEDNRTILLGKSNQGEIERFDPARGPVHARKIRALTVDTSNRLWVATDKGIVIRDASGTLTFWPHKSIPQLESDITTIYVQDAGPNLPQLATHPGG